MEEESLRLRFMSNGCSNSPSRIKPKSSTVPLDRLCHIDWKIYEPAASHPSYKYRTSPHKDFGASDIPRTVPLLEPRHLQNK